MLQKPFKSPRRYLHHFTSQAYLLNRSQLIPVSSLAYRHEVTNSSTVGCLRCHRGAGPASEREAVHGLEDHHSTSVSTGHDQGSAWSGAELPRLELNRLNQPRIPRELPGRVPSSLGLNQLRILHYKHQVVPMV